MKLFYLHSRFTPIDTRCNIFCLSLRVKRSNPIAVAMRSPRSFDSLAMTETGVTTQPQDIVETGVKRLCRLFYKKVFLLYLFLLFFPRGEIFADSLGVVVDATGALN